MLVIAWPAGSDEDLRSHGLAKPIENVPPSGFDLDGTSYQLIANIIQCHSADDLDEALIKGIKELMLPCHSHPPSGHESQHGAHVTSTDTTYDETRGHADEEEVSEDMIRQQVHQPPAASGEGRACTETY